MRLLFAASALIMSTGLAQASSFDAMADIEIKISGITVTPLLGGELTYFDLFAGDLFTDTITSGTATAATRVAVAA